MADTGEPDDPTDDGPSLGMPSFPLTRKKAAAAGEPEQDDVPDPESYAAPRERRRLRPTGLAAAAVTGVVVGVLAVLLGWLATAGCETVRGTSACGGGPGLLVLVGVVVLLVYAGTRLLRLFGASDAGSTSILAVGTMAVLVMVFLLGSTDEWWMAVALPAVTALAYCAAWAVTTAVTDDEAPADSPGPHDVR